MGVLEDVRVYFSPCGIGLGHVGRSIPVAEDLKHRGAEILFSTYLEGFEYVKRQGFPVVSSPPLSLASDSTGRIDLQASTIAQKVPTLRFIQQVTSEMGHMKAFKPDVIVSDTRLSSVVAAKLLGIPIALILNQFQPMVPRSVRNLNLSRIVDGSIMTVIGRGWASSDVILIPDFPEPYTICLDSLRIPSPYRKRVRFIGHILQKDPDKVKNAAETRSRFGVREEQRLIYAAISGPKYERLPLIKLIEPIFNNLSNEYRVVMSMGVPNGGSTPTVSGSLTSIPWAENRFELMKACDLIVCRGGHNTIMQSICYGKPSIIIPTPNHTEQYANARRAMELGVAEAIHQEELSVERIQSLTEKIVNDERYLKRLVDLNSKGFTKGVDNLISTLSDLLKRE